MARNRIHAFAAIVLMVLWAALPALAQERATSTSQSLAPCVDEQTFAVVRIDLARVDTDALFDLAAQAAAKYVDTSQVETLKNKSGGPRQAMKQKVDAFKAAGGETLYVIWSTNDLPGFVLAVPVTEKTNQPALKDWVEATLTSLGTGCPELKQVRKQDLLLVGPKQIVERWEKTAPVIRASLDKATAAAQGAAIQILLVPNDDTKQILGAMLPALAERGIQIDGNAISKGLQWAAIGIDLPPKPAIRMHIQAADAASAATLNRLVADLWQRVGQIPSLRRTCPNLDASLAMLSPAAEGNTSRLVLDDKQCTRLAADFFAPAVVQAREVAANLTCATNLSGLGKAMLIHANDYNDELPASLETLKKTAEVTDQSLSCGCDREGKGGIPYVYRGVDLRNTSANPDLITVYCKRDHRGGRNVLFLDSHVEWMTEEQFQRLIEKDNLLRRQAGLPEKPAD
jgi:prepilin-type processing-associated H-X9-DG protein